MWDTHDFWRFDGMVILQAPSTVQSGATLSMGQEALLQGYMMDTAAATRLPPTARPAMVCVCSRASAQCHACAQPVLGQQPSGLHFLNSNSNDVQWST